MLEELRRHNAIVQERIMKSFGYADTEDFIQKGEDEDLEKAHQDGDIHPKHPDWVWVSSASGGKGDWRTLNGRAHKKHQASQGTQGGQGTSSGSNGTPKTEKPGQQSAKMKVDVPYENLKTINETIAYAKTLSDFTFKREKSDYISDGGKKFSLTNKNGLKMTVDFVNDSEYVYNFKDKYGNILYHNSSTNYNSRTNWKDLFNLKTWSSERISALKSNISKYEKVSRSAKMRYDRSGKSSDYQKYVNNDIWAKNLITVLKGVKKIAELS